MAQKIWDKGGRRDGSESMKRLDKALTSTIDKGMQKVEAKTEHVIEKNAIETHNPHPVQFATDEAKQVVRVIKSSEALVGDDLAEVNKEYKTAKSFAQKHGGGVKPMYGKEVDEGFKRQYSIMDEMHGLKQAMETYTPKHSLSLLQLGSAKVDPASIQASKQDAKSLGKPDLAAKYVAKVEGVDVSEITGKKAAPKEEAAAPAAPKEVAAPAAPKEAAAPAEKSKFDVKGELGSIMKKVAGEVDIQFAPLE